MQTIISLILLIMIIFSFCVSVKTVIDNRK